MYKRKKTMLNNPFWIFNIVFYGIIPCSIVKMKIRFCDKVLQTYISFLFLGWGKVPFRANGILLFLHTNLTSGIFLYSQRPKNIKLFLYNIGKVIELTKGAETAMKLFRLMSTLDHTDLLLIVILLVLDFSKHYPSITTYRAD